MAAIIGKAMLDSGAAEKIIRAMLKVTGEKNAPIGFILSSFFLTIPVFVDTVIFLMMPLAKAMGMRLKKNYLLLSLSVIAGAVMAKFLRSAFAWPIIFGQCHECTDWTNDGLRLASRTLYYHNRLSDSGLPQ